MEIIEQLESQGLTAPPKLAIGDGALGFWKAVAKKWPTTQTQRCWVHKTANVLNKVPKSMLTFYDFPAKHWQHIRTTNPIESVFATVRLRTTKNRFLP